MDTEDQDPIATKVQAVTNQSSLSNDEDWWGDDERPEANSVHRPRCEQPSDFLSLQSDRQQHPQSQDGRSTTQGGQPTDMISAQGGDESEFERLRHRARYDTREKLLATAVYTQDIHSIDSSESKSRSSRRQRWIRYSLIFGIMLIVISIVTVMVTLIDVPSALRCKQPTSTHLRRCKQPTSKS